MKRKLNKDNLIEQLQNQLTLIEDFCTIYDNGKKLIAQEIAVKLRIIYHNTNNSKSLIRQLKLDHVSFIDTGTKYSPNNILSHWGLLSVNTKLGDGGDGKWRAIPKLDNSENRQVGLANWWDGKKIIADKKRNIFTRRRLILELANTDGGAHVDSGLKEDYHELTRKNSLGWFNLNKWGQSEALENPVPPSIRQIAFEALATFKQIDIKNESRLR